jgi:hypothetical protein
MKFPVLYTMTFEEIRSHLKELSDTDLVMLLNEVSSEMKARNTLLKGILGTESPQVRRETITQGLDTLLDALSANRKPR